MTYEELVKKAKEYYAVADASVIQEHMAVEFDVRGEGEGAFYVEVQNGSCDVQPYEYYDKDAALIIPGEVLEDILDGNRSIEQAYCEELLSVLGSLEAAMLFSKVSCKKKSGKAGGVKTAEPKKTDSEKTEPEKKRSEETASKQEEKVAEKKVEKKEEKAAEKASEKASKKAAEDTTEEKTEKKTRRSKKAVDLNLEETLRLANEAKETVMNEVKKVVKQAEESSPEVAAEVRKAAETMRDEMQNMKEEASLAAEIVGPILKAGTRRTARKLKKAAEEVVSELSKEMGNKGADEKDE